jgi:hypothetical protein
VAGAQTQAGPAFAGLRLLGVLAALAPAPAFAGAWIAPKGGQNIATSVVGERDGLVYYEGSGYYEQPAGHDTSLVLGSWLEQNYETEEGWRAEATLAAKHVVFRHDEKIVALQAGALWISQPNEGCSEGGGEFRVLVGRPVGEHAFVNVEAAGRALEGGCEGERLELTAGYHAGRNWLALGQIFFDAPQDGEESIKAELTLVRFTRRGRGFQIGVRARLDGEDPEPALVLGLWRGPRG